MYKNKFNAINKYNVIFIFVEVVGIKGWNEK